MTTESAPGRSPGAESPAQSPTLASRLCRAHDSDFSPARTLDSRWAAATCPVAIVNGLAGFEATTAPDRRAAISRGVDVNRLDAPLRVHIETRHDAGGER